MKTRLRAAMVASGLHLPDQRIAAGKARKKTESLGLSRLISTALRTIFHAFCFGAAVVSPASPLLRGRLPSRRDRRSSIAYHLEEPWLGGDERSQAKGCSQHVGDDADRAAEGRHKGILPASTEGCGERVESTSAGGGDDDRVVSRKSAVIDISLFDQERMRRIRKGGLVQDCGGWRIFGSRRSQAEATAKFAVHMALVDITADGRDLGRRQTVAQQAAAEIGALLHPVGMRGEAQMALEAADQLEAAEAGISRKYRERCGFRRGVFDTLTHTPERCGQGNRVRGAGNQRLAQAKDQGFSHRIGVDRFVATVQHPMQAEQAGANGPVLEDGKLELEIRSGT